jgi:hypothetical protein
VCRADLTPAASEALAELLADIALALCDDDPELALTVVVGPVDFGGD